MTIYVSQDGTISFYQGDSGNIIFSGLPVDKNYKVYFAISDPESNKIIAEELSTNSNYASIVTFALSTDYTEKLKVEAGESCAVYRYGLKICSGSNEYTLIPEVEIENENPKFHSAPKVVVYPKYAEGT